MLKIVPYNPLWTQMFEDEAKLIAKALGENYLELHHFGSTSVPGLFAKPIIDIIGVVRNLENINIKAIENLGYEYRQSPIIPFYYYFTKGIKPNKTHHLHIFEQGNTEIRHLLAFRDYLRANPEDCKRYENLKILLAKEYSDDTRSYTKRKDSFIEKIERKLNIQDLYFRKLFHIAEVDAFHRIIKEQIFDPVPGLEYEYNHPSWQWERCHRFILYKGRDIVNVAMIELLNENLAVLRGFATDKAHQNKGYGKHMINLLEKWVREQGRKELKFHATPEAVDFYKKLGYENVVFEDKTIFKDVIDLGRKL